MSLNESLLTALISGLLSFVISIFVSKREYKLSSYRYAITTLNAEHSNLYNYIKKFSLITTNNLDVNDHRIFANLLNGASNTINIFPNDLKNHFSTLIIQYDKLPTELDDMFNNHTMDSKVISVCKEIYKLIEHYTRKTTF